MNISNIWTQYNNGNKSILYSLALYYKDTKNLKLATKLLKLLIYEVDDNSLYYTTLINIYSANKEYDKIYKLGVNYYNKSGYKLIFMRLAYILYKESVLEKYRNKLILYIPELVYKYLGDSNELYKEFYYILSTKTNNPVFILILAKYYYNNGEYNKSLTLINSYITNLTLNMVSDFYYLASKCYKSMDDKFSYICSLCIASKLNHSKANLEMGKLFLEYNYIDLAIQYLSTSVNLNNIKANYILGNLYYIKGDYKKMIELLPKNNINLDNKDAKLYFKNLCLYYLKTYNYKMLLNTLKLIPHYRAYYKNIVYLDQALLYISKYLH